MKISYKNFLLMGGLLLSPSVNSFIYASSNHSAEPSNAEEVSIPFTLRPTVEFFDEETKAEILRQFRAAGKPNTPQSYIFPDRTVTNEKGEKILLEGRV